MDAFVLRSPLGRCFHLDQDSFHAATLQIQNPPLIVYPSVDYGSGSGSGSGSVSGFSIRALLAVSLIV